MLLKANFEEKIGFSGKLRVFMRKFDKKDENVVFCEKIESF